MADYEKIEQYINGELSPDELTAFELQIQEDKELAAEVILYRNVLNGLQNNASAKAGEAAFLKTLELNKKKLQQPAIVKTIPFYKSKNFRIAVVAIAASVLAAVLLSPLFTKPKNTEQLYAQYAMHDTISATIRGNNPDTNLVLPKIADSLFTLMQSAYNNKQYALALPLLKSYLATHNEVEYKLALGICLLETNQYKEAIDSFQSVAKTENVLKYKAIWYTALSYLKQNKTALCKETLQQIPPEADEYNNAKQLLKQLE